MFCHARPVKRSAVISYEESDRNDARRESVLWRELIIRKIENQSRALAILGREGAEKVLRYTGRFLFGRHCDLIPHN